MENLTYLLSTYGYVAVLVFAFMEGQTAIILAGFLARQGFLDPVLVALLAFFGTAVSDQVYFLAARWKGPALLNRFPRLRQGVLFLASRIHGSEAVLTVCFRFIYGIRNVTPFFLGISSLSTRLFIPLNILGAAAWATACTAVGYFFGHIYAEGEGWIRYLGVILPICLSAAWPVYKVTQEYRRRK